MELVNDHYLSFMIVRDPLERLASCYKDKVVTNPHWSLVGFRKHVKKKAAQITKNKELNFKNAEEQNVDNSDIGITSNLPSKFWEDENSSSDRDQIWPKDRKGDVSTLASSAVKVPRNISSPPRPEDIPSLEEFLEFVLSTDLLGSGFSSHWVPYWRMCTPCHAPYNVIVKLETGVDDLTYLWRKAGLESQVPIPWENRSGGDNNRELADLYSSVPRELLLRVFSSFRLDYEMFGYDINKTLTLAGYSPLSHKEYRRLQGN